jgi:hypothetical protein
VKVPDGGIGREWVVKKRRRRKMEMKTGRTGWLSIVVCMLTALSSSAAVVYFTGASGVDNNFSTAGNWSAYPADGDQFLVAVTNANGIATAANNPAVIDSGFVNRFGGTVGIYSAAGYGAGMAYAAVASGGVLWVNSLTVGYYSGGAYDGTLTLRTGGSITNAFLNAGVFVIGGDASGREGHVIVESGAALFQQTSLSLNTYGTLQFKFGADSVSTLTTTRSTTGATNLLNGLVQVDLSALTTAGTYTLIDSSSANLQLEGSLKDWLAGAGGSTNGIGDFTSTNFQVLNGGTNQWTLSLADNNRDLTLTVIPEPASVGLFVISGVGILLLRRIQR